MNISIRTRQIIEILLHADQGLTISEIANHLEVSPRTVHRELTSVEETVTVYHIELIRKSGLGIKLSGDQESMHALEEALSSLSKIEFTSEDRQLLILCMLLAADEPIKLFAIAHELKAAVSTITNDLNTLEKWVRKWRVALVRKRGLGVILSAPETQLRELIRQVVKLRLDPTELITSSKQLSGHPIYERLFQLAGKSVMSDVESVLWLWEEQWESQLSEDGYTDLLLRLSIGISRIRAARLIQPGEWRRLKYEESESEAGVERLTELLSEHFELSFTADEKKYIYYIIHHVREEHVLALLGDDLSLTQAIAQITMHVEKKFQVDLREDRSLRDGLFHHMKLTLHQLNAGQTIRNPLLEHIMKDYEELFETVRDAAQAYLPNLHIPDEEIGYIVTHYGAALERLKHLQPDVHAILVCSTGIGSSKLLQVRLQKEFPQIRIIDRVSWYEASRLSSDRYDIIISTIDLPINPAAYLKVTPLITQEDADRLLAFIRDTAIVKKPYPVDMYSDDDIRSKPDLDQLLSKKITLDHIIWIIEQFEIVELREEYNDLSSILEVACVHEQHKEVLTEADLVKHRLLDREKNGSQMIPDTTLALFHTRSSAIHTSSLTLFKLNNPIFMDKQRKILLEHFLLMLAPQSLPWEALEVLSEISALLLEEEMIELLGRGDEQDIRQYLTKKLHEFFNTK
ncbi:BglG family transcription antiterminator [Paenibacillus camelliae]|uniref:BglG family transcription antiterminator n=1 Tax=Paenibacillus camelliae TaxID=512410 RepID=UPI00203EA7AC|nr:BglG family transcription antiterminator [Paenibacillus camelliae]MCM3634017.1 BglG family transcription antiterminator [Paenibacillus camelliae]